MKLESFIYFTSSILYSISLQSGGSLLSDYLIMIFFILAFTVMFVIKEKYPNVIIGMIAIMSAIVFFGLDPLRDTIIQSIFPNGYEYIAMWYPPAVLWSICLVLFNPKD